MRCVMMLFLSLYGKESSGEGQGILHHMGGTPWKPVLVWNSSEESADLDIHFFAVATNCTIWKTSWRLCSVPSCAVMGWSNSTYSTRVSIEQRAGWNPISGSKCTKSVHSQFPFFVLHEVFFGRPEARNLKYMLSSSQQSTGKTKIFPLLWSFR